MAPSNRKRLLSNFFALSIIQGTNFLLPILVMPYVIKRIGTDGFGIVAIAQVVMMFFISISDYGFNLTATRDVSLNRDNAGIISRIFSMVLTTRLLLCAVLFILLLGVMSLVPGLRSYLLLYTLAFTTVIGQSLLMNWLFQGIERMKFVTFISLLARFIFVLLVLCFIKTKADNIYFIFFTGLGNVIAGLASIAVAMRLLHIKWIPPTFSEIRLELINGWHITVSNLSVSSYMYVNVLILRLFTSDTVVGYYSIAEKIITAVRQILSVYFQAIYPQLCLMALTGRREVLQFLKVYYLPFLGAVFAGCCILLLFSQQLVGIFIDNHQYIPALFLRIMSFVPFIICLNIPSFQLLMAHHEKKQLLRIFGGGTCINLILNLFLVRIWGPLGTCYVIIITETLITAGLIVGMESKASSSILSRIVLKRQP